MFNGCLNGFVAEQFADLVNINATFEQDNTFAAHDLMRCQTFTGGNLKGYWPGITYGGPGTIYPHVEEIVIDEINRYNEERFGVSVS